MKRLTSLLLAMVMLVTSLAVSGVNAFAAAATKYQQQKQQYNSQHTEFNFAPDKSVKMIYDDAAGKYKAYYAKALTKKGKALFTAKSPTGVAISGDYIYYTDAKAGAIMRIKTNGKGKKTLIQVKKNTYDEIKFLICGTRIVYNLIKYNADTGEIAKTKLYTATLKGKNIAKIAKNVKTDCYSYNGYLYFAKGKSLYRYSFSDGTLKTRNIGLSLAGATLVGMEDNTLYLHYVKDGTQHAFYRVDVEKQRYWKFCNLETKDPIHDLLVYERKVYAITGTGAGNGFAVVNNEQLNYKPFEDLYDTGGESLGFYKNYVVLDNYAVSKKTGDYAFDKYITMVKFK